MPETFTAVQHTFHTAADAVFRWERIWPPSPVNEIPLRVYWDAVSQESQNQGGTQKNHFLFFPK